MSVTYAYATEIVPNIAPERLSDFIRTETESCGIIGLAI